MKSTKTMKLVGLRMTRLILPASGLVAISIASAILFAQDDFYSGYGIGIEGNVNLANELKAPTGALLAAGLLMLAGVFRTEFACTSLTTATVIYLSYGLSRLSSMSMDGIPHDGLVGAAIFELVMGVVCLLGLLRFRRINAH